MLSVAEADSAAPTCSISGPQPQELCAQNKPGSPGRLIFLEFCRGEHESQIIVSRYVANLGQCWVSDITYNHFFLNIYLVVPGLSCGRRAP